METLINLTIDSRPVRVPKGTTILDAAATVGIDIPALCHLDLKGTCVKSSPAPAASAWWKCRAGATSPLPAPPR